MVWKRWSYCNEEKGCQKEYGICKFKKNDKSKNKTTIIKKVTTTKKNNNHEWKYGEKYGTCKKGYCCSKYGWCGKDESYCNEENGCQKEYGICKPHKNDKSKSSTTSTTTEDITSTITTTADDTITTTAKTTEEIHSPTFVCNDPDKPIDRSIYGTKKRVDNEDECYCDGRSNPFKCKVDGVEQSVKFQVDCDCPEGYIKCS